MHVLALILLARESRGDSAAGAAWIRRRRGNEFFLQRFATKVALDAGCGACVRACVRACARACACACARARHALQMLTVP